MAFGTYDGETSCSLDLRCKLDVGTASCHVGGYGHRTEKTLLGVFLTVLVCYLYRSHGAASSLGYDVRLFLMELRIKHLMRYLAHAEHL